MADIVQFPDKHSLAEMLAMTRSTLLAIGLESTAVDWIIEDLRPRLEAAEPFSLSGDAPLDSIALIKGVEKHMKRVTSALIGGMIMLEVELYFARRGGSSRGTGFAEKVRLSGLPFGVIDGGKAEDDKAE
jgi:hypothetical protein